MCVAHDTWFVFFLFSYGPRLPVFFFSSSFFLSLHAGLGLLFLPQPALTQLAPLVMQLTRRVLFIPLLPCFLDSYRCKTACTTFFFVSHLQHFTSHKPSNPSTQPLILLPRYYSWRWLSLIFGGSTP